MHEVFCSVASELLRDREDSGPPSPCWRRAKRRREARVTGSIGGCTNHPRMFCHCLPTRLFLTHTRRRPGWRSLVHRLQHTLHALLRTLMKIHRSSCEVIRIQQREVNLRLFPSCNIGLLFLSVWETITAWRCPRTGRYIPGVRTKWGLWVLDARRGFQLALLEAMQQSSNWHGQGRDIVCRCQGYECRLKSTSTTASKRSERGSASLLLRQDGTPEHW